MKKLAIMAAVGISALTACTNEDSIPGVGENGKEVAFRTVTDKGTRAAVTDATNMLSFTVTGWWDQDGSKSYGNTATGSYLFDAKDITRGEAGTTDWDYTPKRYWPIAGTVDFFAYSPASSKNLIKGMKGLVKATPEIKYTVPAVGENEAQEDFLIATLLDKKSGKVTLNFQHALSRVKFEAKKAVNDIEYLIDGIELVKLNSTAEIDITALNGSSESVFPSTGGFTYVPATPLVMWKNHATLADYKVDFSTSPVAVKYNDYTSVIGVTNGLMVMPQATTLGEVYSKTDIEDKGITFAEVATPVTGKENCFYIKVSYKAFQGTGDEIFYYAGSATSSKEMYLPVKDPLDVGKGLTFEIGRQYTFRLTFGDSSSGTGEFGDAIDFGVTVAPWDDVEVNL